MRNSKIVLLKSYLKVILKNVMLGILEGQKLGIKSIVDTIFEGEKNGFVNKFEIVWLVLTNAL